MATLAMAVDRVPLLKEITSLKTYDWKRSDGTVLCVRNTNSLLHTYAPCDGMKTGFTNAAGHCLIAGGAMHGRRAIVVALNNTRENVWRDSRELLTWSLNR